MSKITRLGFPVYLGIFFLFLILLESMIKETKIPDFTEEEILRFHIRAENNSKKAQREKLEIRDIILSYLNTRMRNVKNKGEAKQIILKTKENLIKIIQNQYRDIEPIAIYFSKEFFPVRKYGSQIMPGGFYEAVRIDLGKAKGRNWWCICYPDFCLIDQEYVMDSKERISFKSWFLEILDKAKASKKEYPKS